MIVKPSYEIEAFDFTEKAHNLAFNGGFENIWDTPTSIAGIADEADTIFHGWIFEKGGTSAPTVTIREETTTVDNGARSCEIQITGAGSGTPVCGIKQEIPNWAEFTSKKVSLRVRGHCSNASKMRAYVDDGVTKTYSGYHTGGGAWEDLDIEDFTCNAALTKLEIGVETVADATFTFYVDSLMFIHGDTSMDYVPRAYFGYFDRGDNASNDFSHSAGITTDGNVHDLDLSSIVPEGARGVILHVDLQDNATGSYPYIRFRKNGCSNWINRSIIRMQVTNVTISGDVVVSLDSDRKIEYSASNTTFTLIYVNVGGWWK